MREKAYKKRHEQPLGAQLQSWYIERGNASSLNITLLGTARVSSET